MQIPHGQAHQETAAHSATHSGLEVSTHTVQKVLPEVAREQEDCVPSGHVCGMPAPETKQTTPLRKSRSEVPLGHDTHGGGAVQGVQSVKEMSEMRWRPHTMGLPSTSTPNVIPLSHVIWFGTGTELGDPDEQKHWANVAS